MHGGYDRGMSSKSVTPEDVDFLKAGLDGEDIAAKLHVTRHAVIVDVEAQALRNVVGVLGDFLREVGSRAVVP